MSNFAPDRLGRQASQGGQGGNGAEFPVWPHPAIVLAAKRPSRSVAWAARPSLRTPRPVWR
jgi:hypothetical protein